MDLISVMKPGPENGAFQIQFYPHVFDTLYTQIIIGQRDTSVAITDKTRVPAGMKYAQLS